MAPVKQKRNERKKGSQCFAINCTNYKNKFSKQQGISFHKFPDKSQHKALYEQWVENCRRTITPSQHARVCSIHFEPQCINTTMQRVVLKEGAVPTIFKLPDHLQHKSPAKRKSRTSFLALGVGPQLPKIPPVAVVAKEHAYNTTEEAAKQKLQNEKAQISTLRKQLKNAKQREKRAKTTCRNLINEIKEHNLIDGKMEAHLELYKDIPCI
ncbi:THAP domain-containing protein 1 B-like isoform X1 [Thalassophryne amazonica]|uniref:THAP domain-containing protein 1 B-like isoform X1 n=1 Tax=Thalassophryne amazonica TaxID=390379 RepID=UPI001470EFE6|nr:THAP domain-containing protein 1 B-like isoform X1 [Thalassophryne amazonica]